MSARLLLLLGAPGAGKGTQAVRLAKDLGIPQISTGEMLRGAVSADSEVGRLARGYMDRGELVPDSVVIEVAEQRLKQPDAQGGFVLDGFPRTLAQARALDAILERLGGPLQRCVALTVEEDVVVERLLKRAESGVRGDDNEETIRTRMGVYRRQTEPLLDYYRGSGILVEVDGDGGIDEVAKRIREALAD